MKFSPKFGLNFYAYLRNLRPIFFTLRGVKFYKFTVLAARKQVFELGRSIKFYKFTMLSRRDTVQGTTIKFMLKLHCYFTTAKF